MEEGLWEASVTYPAKINPSTPPSTPELSSSFPLEQKEHNSSNKNSSNKVFIYHSGDVVVYVEEFLALAKLPT